MFRHSVFLVRLQRIRVPLIAIALASSAASPSLAQERAQLTGHAMALAGVTYAPDGKHLATVSYDQTAKVWDAATGKEVITLSGHTGAIEGVAFSADGKMLATGSYDNT